MKYRTVEELGSYKADRKERDVYKRQALGGYIGILVLYSVLTYIQYTVKYHKAKKSVKQYYTQLTKLEKIYTLSLIHI